MATQPLPSSSPAPVAPEGSHSHQPKMSPLVLTTPLALITLHVGPSASRTTFLIYKDLLCHISPFFWAALNGNFPEALTQTMELDDVDPAIFGHIQHWLLSGGHICTSPEPSWTTLISPYELADRFLMEVLMEAIDHRLATQTYLKVVHEKPKLETVRLIDWIYTKDSDSKKFLRIELVKASIWSDYDEYEDWGHVYNEHLELWLAIVPAEMVKGVVVALDRLREEILDKHGAMYGRETVPLQLRHLEVKIQRARKFLTMVEQEDPLCSNARAQNRKKDRAPVSRAG